MNEGAEGIREGGSCGISMGLGFYVIGEWGPFGIRGDEVVKALVAKGVVPTPRWGPSGDDGGKGLVVDSVGTEEDAGAVFGCGVEGLKHMGSPVELRLRGKPWFHGGKSGVGIGW